MKFLYFLIIPFIILSCTPSKYIFNEYFTPDYEKEIIRTVSVMGIIGDELSDTERLTIDEKFLDEIKTRHKNIAFYDSDYYLNENKTRFNNELWNPFWDNFINNDSVDPVVLFDVSEIIKSNAILQIGIVNVEKIYGEHRKTIGETSVNLRLGLFSLKSGRLLWKADISGTQANAHSDQVVPKTVEAVNVAIINVINNLPFN